MNIVKRNGDIVLFDETKIENAILKAMKYGSGLYEPNIAKEISKNAREHFSKVLTIPTISKIEAFVYNQLIQYDHAETARAYEGYRAVQEFKRNKNTTDDSIMNLIDRINDEVMEENSNKNAYIAPTQRDLIAGEISKDIARRKLIPPYIIQAHDEGILHWHDMDYTLQSIPNCCLVNLEDMLKNGTVVNDKRIESPKSFQTACTITSQIAAIIASSSFGGQSITVAHLAPYLRKSKDKFEKIYSFIKDKDDRKKVIDTLLQNELKAGIQTLRYQLNTLHTSNGQTPFITIYLEIQENSPYEEEMAMICEEIIKQRLEGMQNYKGQIISEAFPKLVYLLDENNCLEGGKYDYITKLAAKCTAKRMVPDYQSSKILRKNYKGCTFPPMGCRSHLSPWRDENGEYKWYGRFNIGVVSINLPQIGIIANKNMGKFWNILNQRLELCKEALLIRYNLLKDTPSDIAPLYWQYGAIGRLKHKEKINKLLENGYATISLGYVGIYEMVQAMLGVSHTTPEGRKFAIEVMEFMKDKTETWKKETGLGFGLYGTPAESLISRFTNIDKKKFGQIKEVTDHMYYTNSYHVSVREKINAFDKLNFEAPFHAISTGGCISYVEVPDMQNNIEAIETLINFIYHNIQYAEINTKLDVCYKCGFVGEIKLNDKNEWYCPNCQNKDKDEMQVMRRSCGYIGTNFWNKGRTQEIKDRVLHL